MLKIKAFVDTQQHVDVLETLVVVKGE